VSVGTVSNVLNRPDRVSANDLVALGLLQQVMQAGVDVPGELAIVGYDDIEFAGAAAVPLSSIHQPRELLGHTATEPLLAETDSTDHVHEQVVYRPELMRMSSNGRPRRASTRPA
jgi:LacI family transcriptional regulator